MPSHRRRQYCAAWFVAVEALLTCARYGGLGGGEESHAQVQTLVARQDLHRGKCRGPRGKCGGLERSAAHSSLRGTRTEMRSEAEPPARKKHTNLGAHEFRSIPDIHSTDVGNAGQTRRQHCRGTFGELDLRVHLRGPPYLYVCLSSMSFPCCKYLLNVADFSSRETELQV